jgi:V/A-type H+-transporting ATPase subunit F
MKKVVFITPTDGEYGFKLAGVTHITSDEEHIEAIIEETVQEPEAGLIIVDERLLKDFPEDKLRKIEQTFEGVILDLPAPERPGAELEDYAAKLIRRAIGYHVKLNL